jgi:hypothetical protein
MNLQNITKKAFYDELSKLASVGSAARLWMAEAKGMFPKETAVGEFSRGKLPKQGGFKIPGTPQSSAGTSSADSFLYHVGKSLPIQQIK